jgi:hypothetical protein
VRRLLQVLAVSMLCCGLGVVAMGCGSRHAKSVIGGARPVVALSGFTVTPGHTYRVWFPVDAGQLRMVAMATDDAANPGATSPLHVVLERVQNGWASRGSPLVAVPLDQRSRPHKNHRWVFIFETHTTLAAGWYRLSLSGRCRIDSYSVAEL